MDESSRSISAEGIVRSMKDGIYGSCAAQGWNCPNHRKKQTNADRIRSFSDEELADFIRELNECCLAGAGMVDCSNNTDCIDCKGVVLEWLQSEVE